MKTIQVISHKFEFFLYKLNVFGLNTGGFIFVKVFLIFSDQNKMMTIKDVIRKLTKRYLDRKEVDIQTESIFICIFNFLEYILKIQIYVNKMKLL